MLEIRKNALLAPGVYEMTLAGDASAITAPGQFINIRLDGLYLRRPISVCDWGEGWIRVIYKVVG
ncbi:MAG TPA: dihydroorotate dehydrogenase electron transfer subunit, partial [Candidatus Alectryocaccomicrobium excrementavium]|nr:dihydroorotate dehydrogenase electron transfer subunit [Candidatus Alectryocaccomicrobium excrementavium]